ncbi:MAG TPA: hypothetical protein VEY05_09470 [Beijerinckiaceae bacterium]|nr:hypothetical protein [Beijerinckiaceae bacterium]
MSAAIDQARAMEGQARALIHAGNLDAAAAVLREAIKILEAAYTAAKDDPAEQTLITKELAVVVGLLDST